jgi:hypothetical protein
MGQRETAGKSMLISFSSSSSSSSLDCPPIPVLPGGHVDQQAMGGRVLQGLDEKPLFVELVDQGMGRGKLQRVRGVLRAGIGQCRPVGSASGIAGANAVPEGALGTELAQVVGEDERGQGRLVDLM